MDQYEALRAIWFANFKLESLKFDVVLEYRANCNMYYHNVFNQILLYSLCRNLLINLYAIIVKYLSMQWGLWRYNHLMMIYFLLGTNCDMICLYTYSMTVWVVRNNDSVNNLATFMPLEYIMFLVHTCVSEINNNMIQNIIIMILTF